MGSTRCFPNEMNLWNQVSLAIREAKFVETFKPKNQDLFLAIVKRLTLTISISGGIQYLLLS